MSTSILNGKTINGPLSARITIAGREYVNFFGAGYLALGGIPEIRAAVRQALDEGTAFSRQIPAGLGAVDPIFNAAEQRGASALGKESSVYFASGYQIGAVGLASFDDTFDVVVLDEHAHPNLGDAATLSGRPIFRFAHCDPNALDDLLRRELKSPQRPLLMTDGAFATSGRVPPLQEYATILANSSGHIFVDESHSFGVVGKNGRGAAEFCGIESIAAVGSTLSKAFCAQGAIVGGTFKTIDRLRMKTPVRGACAGSPLSATATVASLHYVAKRPELRTDLRTMADYLRSRLRGIGVDCIDTPAPIVTFSYGSAVDMQELQRRLFDRGIIIYHSNYVGAGKEGVIRCGVFRDHTQEDIDTLVDAMA